MKQQLNTSVEKLVDAARPRIQEIDASDAIAMAQTDNTLVVDIRDIRERQRDGYIPDSFHCPRGMTEFWIDPTSPYFKSVFEENTTFLFHCAVDWRSVLTVATVTDMGFQGAISISGGLKAWKQAGGPIEKTSSD